MSSNLHPVFQQALEPFLKTPLATEDPSLRAMREATDRQWKVYQDGRNETQRIAVDLAHNANKVADKDARALLEQINRQNKGVQAS